MCSIMFYFLQEFKSTLTKDLLGTSTMKCAATPQVLSPDLWIHDKRN